MPQHKPLITAKGLTVRSGRKLLLDALDFDIFPGEALTLIGPNGAGKTTLIRTIIGTLPISGGTLHRKPGLRLGYTPQKLPLEQLIPMPVDRFMALSGERNKNKRADMLARCDAQALQSRQMSDLSGGETQRVLLARALMRAPDLLILDEPTQGLDQPGEARFYALLEEIRKETSVAVFMVSHDLHMVMAQSDRVICLNQHICCSGTPGIVAQDPSYVELFGGRAGIAPYRHHHHEHCDHD
ncbi:MAG: ATP-binding cassette domain-containing protein [Rhodobacteraceae bacterium]|nr:ATP-binding cassette domain-containing protein [Paracoccaceae bacterium]